MSVTVTWTGLEELRQALVELPSSLASQAQSLVNAAADATARDVASGYPVRTGLMRARVSQRERAGSALYARDVVSGAPHAHLWESGTVDRVTRTGHKTGHVPAHESAALATTAAPRQAELLDQLRTLVAAAPAVGSVTS